MLPLTCRRFILWPKSSIFEPSSQHRVFLSQIILQQRVNMIARLRTLSFWHLQIGGWALFWLIDCVLMATRMTSLARFAVMGLDAPFGFALTLILRQIYKRFEYRHVTIIALLAYVLFWSAACTILWYSIRIGLQSLIFGTASNLVFLDYRYAIRWINFYTPVCLGWSSLYFGTKYWWDWENEKARASNAVSLAHSAQMQMLRYQLNPHFLFNALNSVRALIQEDKRLAKEMITELSEFLRYSLIHRDHSDVPLHEEMDAIRHYLSIEKKRFEDKLLVTFAIAPEAEEFPVLSFLIHPLVENAVKYGMKTSPMPLTLRIEAEVRNNNLRLLIANSGAWRAAEDGRDASLESTGTGLMNVRARLQNAYPDRHRFTVEQREGNVVIVIEIIRAPEA